MNLLIISTISCALEYVAPILIRYLILRLYTMKKYDADLRNELINLKREMAEISMVDEFSKYAKLQRKYNKLEQTLIEKVNARVSTRMKIQTSITYAFRVLNGLFILVLIFLYKSEPVIILPKGTLWPIQNFLSWPNHYEDSISAVMWLAITRLVISMRKKIEET